MSDAMRSAVERAHAFRSAARAFAPRADPEALAADLAAWRARSAGALEQTLAAACAALGAANAQLAEQHEQLLGTRAGAVACRETAYADARRIAPTDLADLAGFLCAFGVEPAHGPPDHVATECELASLLSLKEAYALGEGWSERAEIARTAYERLLGDHLARWLPRFAARVVAAAPASFHAAAAAALAELVSAEAVRIGIAVAHDGELAPDDDGDDDGAPVCGVASGCTLAGPRPA